MAGGGTHCLHSRPNTPTLPCLLSCSSAAQRGPAHHTPPCQGPPLTVTLLVVVGDREGVHGLGDRLRSPCRLSIYLSACRALSRGVRKGWDVAELAGPGGGAETFVLLEADSPILADEGAQDCRGERVQSSFVIPPPCPSVLAWHPGS